jgi:hypothetical protein
MSRGITLQTVPVKGKDLTTLTYEQVADSDNFLKKRSTPAELIVDGLTPQARVANDTRGLKPRTVTPGFLGPLDDSDAYSEIPKPAPLTQCSLKLKTYDGKKA